MVYFDKPGTGFLRMYWIFDRTNEAIDARRDPPSGGKVSDSEALK